MTLPYPPPWMDAATLAAHLCISTNTVDAWVKQAILPPARMVGGKRMWKFSEVEASLQGSTGVVSEGDLVGRVFHATKAAQNR